MLNTIISFKYYNIVNIMDVDALKNVFQEKIYSFCDVQVAESCVTVWKMTMVKWLKSFCTIGLDINLQILLFR